MADPGEKNGNSKNKCGRKMESLNLPPDLKNGGLRTNCGEKMEITKCGYLSLVQRQNFIMLKALTGLIFPFLKNVLSTDRSVSRKQKMSLKNNKTLLIVATILVLLTLFYQNLDGYQEQRIHMLINDYLLSWQKS